MSDPDAILRLGIDAAREGNREEARSLFSLLTREDPGNVQGWLWLAGVAEHAEQRRMALERVVALDPTNEMALNGLKALGAARRSHSVPTAASLADVEPVAAPADEERYASQLDATYQQRRPGAGAAPSPRPVAYRDVDRDEDDDAADSAPSSSQRLVRPLLIAVVFLLGIGLVALAVVTIFNRAGGGDASEVATLPPTLIVEPTASLPLEPTGDPAGEPVIDATTEPVVEPPTATIEPTPTPTPIPTQVPPEQAAPTLLQAGEVANAGGWSYTLMPGYVYGAVGNVIGGNTAQGQYAVVLALVSNKTGIDQPVPQEFFVLKDAAGGVYPARPDLAQIYVQRGATADIALGDVLPANETPTSVMLIFDVPPGATSLVLFSRENTTQGWLAVASVP
ncbi:MAG: hypothetical protein KGS47_01910 [Chloroflexi bacterium]|nr:hypothetical protein [Chloroflexota bacterium]